MLNSGACDMSVFGQHIVSFPHAQIQFSDAGVFDRLTSVHERSPPVVCHIVSLCIRCNSSLTVITFKVSSS